MIDESLLEILGEDFGMGKHWQWLYRTNGSPLWSITNLYMTKAMFEAHMRVHNELCPRNRIVEWGKAKITKRLFTTVAGA